MTLFEPVCVAPTSCLFGRSPLWSASEGFLWWSDFKRAKLHRFNPKTGNTRRYDLPLRASCSVLTEGRLLLAGDRQIGIYDPETEDFERLVTLGDEPEGNRTNDGAIGPDGRFWFGTMDASGELQRGRYYRLAKDGVPEKLALPDVLITNTFEFSPDGSVFYTADTVEQEIHAYDHDTETGELGPKRVFASTVVEGGGSPEGSAIDQEGFLWNAQSDSASLVRYRPDGQIDRVVKLPVSRPTGCAFGGRDLRTLYITTARSGLSKSRLDREPLAGSLFAIDVDIPGLKVREWGQKASGGAE